MTAGTIHHPCGALDAGYPLRGLLGKGTSALYGGKEMSPKVFSSSPRAEYFPPDEGKERGWRPPAGTKTSTSWTGVT